MDEDPLPDLSDPATRDAEPREERVNHLAYILIALVVMLIFWYAG